MFKLNYTNILLPFSVVLCFVVIYLLLLDYKGTFGFFHKYYDKTLKEMENYNIRNLLNSDNISNLPQVDIITDNKEIQQHTNCKLHPLYMGNVETSSIQLECKNLCGSNAQITKINDGDEFYFNNTMLHSGYWCMYEQVHCNSNTAYFVSSLDGYICKSKYPNIFGGENNNEIIACKNEQITNNNSYLWDYLNDEAVNPLNIRISNEDELIPFTNEYRFRCKYTTDESKNQYLPHPLNRFHPIKNVCTTEVINAHPDVKLVYDNNSWYCDCGDFITTRVQHKIPGDIQSTCTACINQSKDLGNNKHKDTYRYECYTQHSPYYKMSSNIPPCSLEQFESGAYNCDVLSLTTRYESGIADMPFAPYKISPFQLTKDNWLYSQFYKGIK